ncbi:MULTISPECIES: hypothetical protein [Acetobacter]|uniref:Uncharacterized protein n=1 Tax=Acetobacter cerevisiae TaxID=178900 RepID=A0A149VET3_9PROT|nr:MULTISPECIES: hypothetical protein [Acetobacter]KXV78636.1 hypothetical protein AD954_02005 [Acetobacter cerevisiae]
MEQTPGTPKALMAAVIGMGILIVVGTLGLVGVIIHRMGSHTPSTSAALSAPAVPLQDAPARPVLPAGTHLISMARVRDDLLALHVSTNGEDRILLWQVSTGRILPGIDSAAPFAGATP